MRSLNAWTGGLVGDRDPAQPLLTTYAAGGRVELSGATTANWVAKSANLLVDGLGSPSRVGLLLPLHWQTVALLLAGVATGATVAVCADAEGLGTCDVAFVIAAQAGSAVDLGIDEVFALSGHPFGGPVSSLAPMAQDYSREVPSYADAWSGPAPTTVTIEVAGAPLGDLPELPVTKEDRVLVDVDLTVRHGLAALLSVLRSGASLVLAPSPHGALDLAKTAADERVTATLGLSVPGLRALDMSL